MDSPLCRREHSPNEFTHSAGNASGNFAAQRATYTYENKGEQIRAEGCWSNCVKKCKRPKIKTPGISREHAPDCAEQSQQIGLHTYANHSPPSSVDPWGSTSKSLVGRPSPSMSWLIYQLLHDKGWLKVPFLINHEDINKYVHHSSLPCGESLTLVTCSFSPAGWSIWLITASWSSA